MSMLLTLITFIPLVGVLLIGLVPKSNTTLPKWIAAVVSAVDLGRSKLRLWRVTSRHLMIP